MYGMLNTNRFEIFSIGSSLLINEEQSVEILTLLKSWFLILWTSIPLEMVLHCDLYKTETLICNKTLEGFVCMLGVLFFFLT